MRNLIPSSTSCHDPGLTGGMGKLAGHGFRKCLSYVKTRHGVWWAEKNDTALVL